MWSIAFHTDKILSILLVIGLHCVISPSSIQAQESLQDKEIKHSKHHNHHLQIIIGGYISSPLASAVNSNSSIDDLFLQDQFYLIVKKHRFSLRAGGSIYYKTNQTGIDSISGNTDYSEINYNYNWQCNLALLHYFIDNRKISIYAGPAGKYGAKWEKTLLEPGFDRITIEQGGLAWGAGLHYGGGFKVAKRIGIGLDGGVWYQQYEETDQTKFELLPEFNRVKSKFAYRDIKFFAPISISLFYRIY